MINSEALNERELQVGPHSIHLGLELGKHKEG